MEETKIRFCKRCGRRLKSDEAIERGMGKVCWQKSQHTNSNRLFRSTYELSKDN